MIEVVDRRDGWVGLRSRPATDWKRALVEYGTYSIRAKWRSLRSARASTLKKVLDTAGIVRDACSIMPAIPDAPSWRHDNGCWSWSTDDTPRKAFGLSFPPLPISNSCFPSSNMADLDIVRK